MVKKYLIIFSKSIGVIALSAIVGFLLLLLVYTIPTSAIREHIRQSQDIFLTERDYPRVHSWTNMWRDNYTDALMIGHAGYEGEESTLDKTLFVYRNTASYQGNSLLPAETLIAVFADDSYADNPDFSFGRSDYSRYWHGYLVFLKPLLCLFTYGQIRTFNAILQAALLIAAPLMVFGVNGADTFSGGFVQLTIMYMMCGLFDRVFIDWYWVGHTKAWIIPGTEDLLPYIHKKTWIKKIVYTVIGYPLAAALISWIVTSIFK